MDDYAAELSELFAAPNSKLEPDVLRELQSILRIHNLDAQELFYKWESYCLKMGAEDTKLDLKTARDFKKDIQENLERETRGKQVKTSEKRPGVNATPRAGGGDVFGV
jgi:DNA polymerase alpha subunit B